MIPGSVHLSPVYPSAQLQVSLATQAPCTQGGSHTAVNQKIHMHVHTPTHFIRQHVTDTRGHGVSTET